MMQDDTQHAILVVDDEPGILEAYRDCLAPARDRRVASARMPATGATTSPGLVAARYRLLEASSGEQALELVRREREAGRSITCGFFDMRMPAGMDGLTTLREVRALDADVLCTIVTADPNRSIDEIARIFGAGHEDEWDYLAKPFTAPEIVQKARCMVSSWVRRRERDAHLRGLGALMRASRRVLVAAGAAAPDATAVALEVMRSMVGGSAEVVVRVDESEARAPTPLYGSTDVGAGPSDALLRTAARRGTATGGGWLATALPGEWPRVVVACRGLEFSPDVATEFGELLRTTLDGMSEHATLWTRLADRGRELERAVADLQDAQARLVERERLAAMGQLSASVAHEINNPLTWTLAGYDAAVGACGELSAALDRIEAPAGDATARAPLRALCSELRERHDEMGDGLRRIMRIVKDMRRMSHADEDAPQPIALDDTVRSAMTLGRGLAIRVGSLDVALASGVHVIGYEGRLVQVFANLLANAAQAIEEQRRPSGERGRVEVRSGSDGRMAWVSVRDDGGGIPPEVLGRIFEPFYTTKDRGRGSGLGLTISLDIVKRHGGTIDVETKHGVGTCFTVRLPAAVAALDGTRTITGEMDACADVEVSTDPLRREAPLPQVLIVDDEPLVLNALHRTLASRCAVTVAHSAHEALSRIEAGGHFDALLCDLIMPGMDGAAFYEALQDRAPALADRFIVITGGACSPSTAAFLHGFTGPVLSKPVAAHDLFAAVETRCAGQGASPFA